MGATTIWERWDSMLPDGTINPGQMTSFNHYALGAVADWMHRTIGGIAPLEPGYARVLVAPQPGGGLTWARSVAGDPARTGVGVLAAGRRPAASPSTVRAARDVGQPQVRLPDGTEHGVGRRHQLDRAPDDGETHRGASDQIGTTWQLATAT